MIVEILVKLTTKFKNSTHIINLCSRFIPLWSESDNCNTFPTTSYFPGCRLESEMKVSSLVGMEYPVFGLKTREKATFLENIFKCHQLFMSFFLMGTFTSEQILLTLKSIFFHKSNGYERCLSTRKVTSWNILSRNFQVLRIHESFFRLLSNEIWKASPRVFFSDLHAAACTSFSHMLTWVVPDLWADYVWAWTLFVGWQIFRKLKVAFQLEEKKLLF